MLKRSSYISLWSGGLSRYNGSVTQLTNGAHTGAASPTSETAPSPSMMARPRSPSSPLALLGGRGPESSRGLKGLQDYLVIEL